MILFKYMRGSYEKWLILAFSMLSIALFIYPALHEIGHALTVKALGGEVTYIGLTAFNACISYKVETSASGYALIDVSGVIFPFLVWLLFLLFSANYTACFMHILRFSASVYIIISFIPWLVIPLFSYIVTAPMIDDISKFIGHSGWEPEMVTFLFAGLFVTSITLLQKVIKDIEVIE